MEPSDFTYQLINFINEAVYDVLSAYLKGHILLAPTIQKVRNIRLRPDISSFLLIYGDYSILFTINFSGPTALALYKNAIAQFNQNMEDFPKQYTSEEVINFISEIANQIAGRLRRRIAYTFHIIARSSQPKALLITSDIRIYLKTNLLSRNQCWKLTYRYKQHNPFYIEFSYNPEEIYKLTIKHKG